MLLGSNGILGICCVLFNKLNGSHPSGQVYSLGRAEYGRLGLGQGAEETSEPTLVKGVEPVCNVTSGTCASFAVTREGEE